MANTGLVVYLGDDFQLILQLATLGTLTAIGKGQLGTVTLQSIIQCSMVPELSSSMLSSSMIPIFMEYQQTLIFKMNRFIICLSFTIVYASKTLFKFENQYSLFYTKVLPICTNVSSFVPIFYSQVPVEIRMTLRPVSMLKITVA